MMWLLLYRESVGGRENGSQKEGVIGDGVGGAVSQGCAAKEAEEGEAGRAPPPSAHLWLF